MDILGQQRRPCRPWRPTTGKIRASTDLSDRERASLNGVLLYYYPVALLFIYNIIYSLNTSSSGEVQYLGGLRRGSASAVMSSWMWNLVSPKIAGRSHFFIPVTLCIWTPISPQLVQHAAARLWSRNFGLVFPSLAHSLFFGSISRFYCSLNGPAPSHLSEWLHIRTPVRALK